MGSSSPPQLQQIHFGVGPRGYEPVTHHKAKPGTYIREHDDYQAAISSLCPFDVWPRGSYRLYCPRPILVGKQHLEQLSELHQALSIAIVDIVGRWWTDEQAEFPKRMPLEKQEEDFLQWIESQVSHGDFPPYSACQGSWRPDFMIEEDESHPQNGMVEKFRITEINARFSFNGFMHAAYGQRALEDMGIQTKGLISAVDSDKLLDGVFSFATPDDPLHLLMGEEVGFDIHLFVDAAKRRRDAITRVIHPSDLRLVPDPKTKEGYLLCCIIKNNDNVYDLAQSSILTTSSGETVEEIKQVGLELFQSELISLEPEMLRQISRRCFNDMRTIFLIHDKRMLAIVKQELEPLVTQGVLTSAQAKILDEGIPHTILPGSQELEQLLQLSSLSPKMKDDYIIKPVRDGKGAGIVFGEDLTPDEWISALGHLRSPGLISGTNGIVQRRIIPRLYDVILRTSGERLRYPLVGTYHSINGKFIGLGVWRSNNDRICAIDSAGSCLSSVIDAGDTH
ncbi:uncharacterized protein GGS22DRAFT_160426 [Annulohypoxylon maeteangense]|uniref:uncharacterized protein n=1 Tax=Annulohypoxylon maeteangense TaxID=1927788 RepID=UPI002008E2C8|nr:uncharacterized protein GGS22DRAFT_160426 [Annulohypoxylon maeteangense]KAI0886270.1 hypothetical protein GGS22DRAFT_160426 [Annulohypoxylon maeteangense]